jgi:DNA end-binding protein Ku
MARSMWKGAIQFGLVTIPVKLYLATESKGVSFNMLHAECHGRIQMKTYCPTDDAYIERSDTVRGYEIGSGQYIVVTDDDLASVPLKTVRSIEIEQFVPVDAEGESTRFIKQAYYL